MVGTTELKVPAYGWAARDASGHLSPFSFKRREPGPKDVVFDVKYCGICHSDLHQIKNEWGASDYPMVPGHEIIGIVTKVGSEVTKFKPGDRVGVGCLVDSCMDCDACHKGLENYCPKMVWSYNSKGFDGHPTQGGYSNVMVVKEHFALKVPENLPMDAAAPLLCAGITVFSPMKHFEMEKGGKNFGVIGLGGLGHMAAKIAKSFGMNVTVISTSPNKEKEARENLHADNFLVSKDPEAMKAAASTLDFIIDTVSAPHAEEDYLSLLKVDGKLVIVGVPPHKMSISPGSLINARRTLGGSLIGGLAETQECLDFCGKHNLTCAIEKIPISYVNEAMVRLFNSDVHYRFVIDIENTLKEE
jgi:D-arabinose 1-dehydrogenase-like Zn-dependent alcohol dehydrogenase